MSNIWAGPSALWPTGPKFWVGHGSADIHTVSVYLTGQFLMLGSTFMLARVHCH